MYAKTNKRFSMALNGDYILKFKILKDNLILANPKQKISDSDVLKYLLDMNINLENVLHRIK